MKKFAVLCTLWLASLPSLCQKPSPGPVSKSPVSITIYDRTRIDAVRWFSATPNAAVYGYFESLLRIGVAQKRRRSDWQLELTQPSELALPNNAVSLIPAQGQLGLGGTYYAANHNQTNNAAGALKQAFIRLHGSHPGRSLRVGRFEFFDGQETTPKDKDLLYLQTNRMVARMVGNFGFSNAQRSFDGVDGHYNGKSWDLTAMAARADQGVFNMNANPELNVDLQYLAYSKYNLKDHLLWRVFAMDYHDGRTGLTKTDNRPLAVRQTDHRNIRLGSYGADFRTTLPVGAGKFDLLAWGVLQNGNWGVQNHHAGAVAVEGGYHATQIRSAPWLRGGFMRSTGDNNSADDQHNTFFWVLPTPRTYARFPFYNMMNSQDQFLRWIDMPTKHLDLRGPALSPTHLKKGSLVSRWRRIRQQGFWLRRSTREPAQQLLFRLRQLSGLSGLSKHRAHRLLRSRKGQECRCGDLSRRTLGAVRLRRNDLQMGHAATTDEVAL